MHHADVFVVAATDTQRAVMAMTMLMKMKIVAVAGVIGGVIVVFGLVSQKYLHFKTNSSLSLPFSLSHPISSLTSSSCEPWVRYM